MITPYSQIQTKEDVIVYLDDDSKLVLPICKSLLTIFRKMIDPDEDNFVVVSQDEAPILGLFHKQVRFFKYYIDAYEADNADICCLLNRIIYEAYIKMRYLIDNPQDIKEYRALSFKPHIEIINNQNLAKAPSMSVFRHKFESAIAVEGISEQDILNARKNPGGKSFRQMQEKYESLLYHPIYAMSSDSIHSGWNEVRQMYLRCDEENKQYYADIEYSQVLHYRLLISIADVLVSSAFAYYDWSNLKLPGVIPDLSSILYELRRVCYLINEVISDTYNNNPDEYYKN